MLDAKLAIVYTYCQTKKRKKKTAFTCTGIHVYKTMDQCSEASEY